LNLGQLLQLIPDIKRYIFNSVPSKPTLPKPILPKPTVASITIDHQMAIIQFQARKNFIKDVLLDGGFRINIIIEKLRVQLGFSKPKLAPYNLFMANETITNSLGLIKDLKKIVHGIPYAMTFTIIHNSVLNSSYFMLLGHI
jgi:hypothetical protein